MSLTSSMLVGFTGVQANQVTVDTVGDNIANLNTTGFKSQRTLFDTLLYRTISEGTAPDRNTGGTLPRQIGTGVTVGAIQRNFQQGTIESTGFAPDLAVDGQGFFILETGAGEQVYTRDGAFHLDANSTLVATNGAPVQVFPADAAGNIAAGTLSDLVIPLGTAGVAVATTNVVLDGRLDPGGPVAATGAVVASAPLVTASGAPATATTPLTSLVDAAGVPLLATGDVLTINATKGGISIPEATFVVGTTGNTVGDFAAHLETVLGIDVNAVAGGQPGVTVAAGPTPPAGSLVVASNVGGASAISLDGASIRNTTGAIASPFGFALVQPATGEAVTTSFRVFDSLGNPVEVRLRLAQTSQSSSGTTWAFTAESVDSESASPVIGSGTISFDQNGQFVASTGTQVSIDRSGVGAASPLALNLTFDGVTGLAGSDGGSSLVMASQDGSDAGILIGYDVQPDGVVIGTFSNQQTQVFGQLALATFVNEEGLLARSENVFVPGPDSGPATLTSPQTAGTGFIVSGALEQSNVEISREFIDLITASAGVSASGRVIRTADDLLQELLLIAR
ncbi:MAG: flagellar hook-basal body complex protein [Phycisphaerae bacterium]